MFLENLKEKKSIKSNKKVFKVNKLFLNNL